MLVSRIQQTGPTGKVHQTEDLSFFQNNNEALGAFWNFTDSQNGWSWKRPLEVIWCKSLVKQEHLEQAIQDYVQAAFDYD